MKKQLLIGFAASAFTFGANAFCGADNNWNNGCSPVGKVAIVKGVGTVAGISRNQNTNNTVNPDFRKDFTSLPSVLYPTNCSIHSS